MALGAIGSIASGIGSVLGGIGGSRSQDRAAETQARELRRQNQLAERLMDAQLADVITPRGDRVIFDEDRGEWSHDLTDMTRRLLEATDQEELARLTGDADIRRAGLEQNFARRGDEGQAADTYLRQLQQESPYDRERLQHLLADRAMSGIGDAYDTVSRNLTTQALRSGASGGSRIMENLAQQRGQDTADALRDAELQSFGMFEDLEGQRTGRLGNLYNTLASRASNFEDTPFQPTQIPGQLQQTGQGMRSGTIGAGQIASSGPANAAAQLAQRQSQQMPASAGLFAGLGGLVQDAGGLMNTLQNRRQGDAQSTFG